MTQEKKHTPDPWTDFEKPYAWVYPDEPTFDGTNWKPEWSITDSEKLAKWKAKGRKVYPLFFKDPAAEIAALRARVAELEKEAGDANR